MVNKRRWTLFIMPTIVVFALPIVAFYVVWHGRRQHKADTAALIKAVLSSDDSNAILMLSRGADPNAVVTKADLIPQTAEVLAEYQDQRRMNTDLGPDPPSTIVLGPILTVAIRSGHFPVAEALIAHGAKVNVRDSAKSTPLTLAITTNQASIVSALLDHGSDTNMTDEGKTPLFFCVGNSDESPATVLLLMKHGANINFQEPYFGQTPLMRQATSGFVTSKNEMLRLLLQFHPNLELRDMRGNTALRLAEKDGSEGVIKLLTASGAKHYSLFPPLSRRKTVYTITDLGVGRANAINNKGEVVGLVTQGKDDGNGQLVGQAFFWSRGRMQLFKAFHGPSSVALGINDRGQVVGAADFFRSRDASSYTRHAFLWQNGVMQDLHPKSGWATEKSLYPSSGVSISNDGLVAEVVNNDSFLWRRGRWKDLKTDYIHGKTGIDSATPVAMNNKRQIIIYMQSSGSETAGIWEGGKLEGLERPQSDTITIEGREVKPMINYSVESINDKGVIVGDSYIWSQNKIASLPTLYHHGELDFDVKAKYTNNSGQIVGAVSDDLNVGNPEQHAVLWQKGKVVDLNAFILAASGWILEEARGINEVGQIVGHGTFRGKRHAFLLTPSKSDAKKN